MNTEHIINLMTNLYDEDDKRHLISIVDKEIETFMQFVEKYNILKK